MLGLGDRVARRPAAHQRDLRRVVPAASRSSAARITGNPWLATRRADHRPDVSAVHLLHGDRSEDDRAADDRGRCVVVVHRRVRGDAAAAGRGRLRAVLRAVPGRPALSLLAMRRSHGLQRANGPASSVETSRSSRRSVAKSRPSDRDREAFRRHVGDSHESASDPAAGISPPPTPAASTRSRQNPRRAPDTSRAGCDPQARRVERLDRPIDPVEQRRPARCRRC